MRTSGTKMRYEISIPARVDAISPAVDAIMSQVQGSERGKRNAFAIETALREALANAILHGCKGDSTKQVHCEVVWDETEGVEVIVRDPGEGFDPKSLADPLDHENLHADHGRGIHLIQHLMDKVEYANGGREIRMRKS